MNETPYSLNDWKDEAFSTYIVSTCVQSLVLIAGIVGNSLVIIIYTWLMKSKNDDRYFIPILAWVDVLGCTFATTQSLVENHYPLRYISSLSCKILNFATASLIVTSMLFLMVISVHRYQKICRPFGFQMNLKCKRVVTVSTIVCACVLCFQSFIMHQSVEVVHKDRNITGYECKSSPGVLKDSFLYVIISIEGASVICMSVMYALVAHRIHRRFGKGNTVSPNQIDGLEMESKKDKSTSGRRISIMFMVISVISVVCFIPSWTFILLQRKDPDFWRKLTFEETQVSLIFRRVYILNHAVNPFIYGFFDPKFRLHMKKWMVYFAQKCRIENNRETVSGDTDSITQPTTNF